MRKLKPFFMTAVAFATCQVVAQTSAPAASQGSTADTGQLGNVVVTARRIGESMKDVPLSIQALSGKDLEERSITSIAELSQYTPGLSYTADLGRVGERPVVRGITTLIPTAPQATSVFVDGVYQRYGALGLLLDDADRVEVIKGPQSALYGRSTYAGAINYVTVKPSHEVDGRIAVTGGQNGESSVFGAISFPVLKDVLAARVTAKHHQFGGQYTNSLTGQKIGNERTNAAGVQLLFTPSKALDALFSVNTSSIRDGQFAAVNRPVPIQAGGVITNQNGSTNIPNGGVCDGKTINIVGNNAAGIPDAAVAPSATNRLNGWPCGPSILTDAVVRLNTADMANYTDPKTGISYGNVAGLDRKTTQTALTLNYRFDNGYTLTSQSSYTRQNTNNGVDESYAGGQFSIFGTSWLSYNRDEMTYYTQELRLASPQTQPLTWLVGAFVYKEDTNGMGSGVIVRDSKGQIVGDPLVAKSTTSASNVAPFGRVQYEIDKSMRISLEGRYNKETVEIGGTPLGTAKVTAGTCMAGEVCIIQGSQTFTDFSPRLTFDYKASNDTLLYAQGARGSKSGGFNQSAGLPASSFTYDGEKIQSYEIGIKTMFDNRRLSFNAALFRNDIDGLQLSNLAERTDPVSGSKTTATIVNNVGKAHTQGLEFDLAYRATKWLTVTGNYAYTDAVADEGTELTQGTVYGGNRSVTGFKLPRTPQHSAAASVAVDFPISADNLRFFARTDVIYQSRRYAELQNTIWADPFTHINLSAGVRGPGWRVTGWVKNATDDNTSVNGFRYRDPATFRLTAVDFLPRLRQAGVTLTFDF